MTSGIAIGASAVEELILSKAHVLQNALPST